jgi:hypothetical protein
MRIPIRTLGLVAASLLIGSALSPASAQQQQSGLDGQVALRSDGALYLISNGQRRWVSTVIASDDQINAIPEGDPILVGLAPIGSSFASTSPQAKPSGTSTSASSSNRNSSSSSSGNDNSQQSSSSGDDDDADLSTDIPVTVDIDGSTRVARGESRKVEMKTQKDVTCELVVRYADKKEVAEDSKNADSRGSCKYTIDIPDNAAEGTAKLIGTAREGGKLNRAQIDLDVKKK